MTTTVNFINCTVNTWSSDLKYTGFLLLQDYTSSSVETEETNNLFSKDKLTINFTNCYGPNGKIMVDEKDLYKVCGSQDKEQLIYVYGNKSNKVIPYGDGHRYPAFTFA